MAALPWTLPRHVRTTRIASHFFWVVTFLTPHTSSAFAADESQNGTPSPAPERFAIHGQFTYVEQETGSFNAPYAGPNSLSSEQARETADLTLFAGARLWPGAEIWINPEIDQGFGLDDTLGVAGFPSGEAYKVGKNQPYFRLPRLFVRETLDLDG
jgi:high affinity Mn2+ porin